MLRLENNLLCKQNGITSQIVYYHFEDRVLYFKGGSLVADLRAAGYTIHPRLSAMVLAAEGEYFFYQCRLFLAVTHAAGGTSRSALGSLGLALFYLRRFLSALGRL